MIKTEIQAGIDYEMRKLEAVPGLEIIARYDEITPEEWRALRRTGIGGSDVAGIMGVSKYSSPLSVYMDKTGRLKDRELDSEAAEMGNILEPFIRSEIAPKRLIELGYNVQAVYEPTAIYRSIKYPWMIVNLDGAILIDDELYILEVKTGNSYVLQQWGGVDGGEIPQAYRLQEQHYLKSTEYFPGTLVFGVIGNNRIVRFDYPDPELQADMIDIERSFWQKVEENNPLTAPLATEIDLDLLTELYPSHSGQALLDLSDIDELLEDYAMHKIRHKSLESYLDELKARIYQQMEGFSLGEGDRYRVSISDRTRTGIDSKRLKAELPEIAERYETISSYSVLTVKERKR